MTAATDLAYLSLGTGLAAGLLLDGRLRRGHHGAAGEIGHIPVDPSGSWCTCGQLGCLETTASGSALAAAWPLRRRPARAGPVRRGRMPATRRAIAARDRFAGAGRRAVRLSGLTVNVECVVLGGGVAQLGEPLRDVVADALREQAAASPFLAVAEPLRAGESTAGGGPGGRTGRCTGRPRTGGR